MEAVEVVVGIILSGNKFLVERRRLDETIDPGIVCLPAGHVEPNESLEDALKRELIEELGIQVNHMEFLCKNFYVASNGEKQHAYCYIVTDYVGKPVCRSAEEIFWEDNVENLSLEIDKETVSKMKEIQEWILLQERLNCLCKEDIELDKNGIIEKLSKILKTIDYRDANAAVLVLLRVIDQELQVLLVKRAEKPTDPWSGQIAFPGGKRDLEDKDLKETVVRETLEEAGINIFVRCRFLGAMGSIRSTQRPEMKILPFVVLQEKEQEIKLNEELTEYFWTPLKEKDLNKGCIKYRCEDFPAFIIGGNVIWGLTYRILYNLLASLSSFEKETQRKAWLFTSKKMLIF